MAELLVVAANRPVPAGPGRWLRGHVVNVMEDGHAWGAEEGLPKFVIVKVPNIDAEDVEHFIEVNLDGLGALVRRRNWFFDRDKLTANQLNELQTTGEITLTRVQIKAIKTALS